MNILFVTPRIPYPLDSGAKIRMFNLLKGLSLDNKVILLSFMYNKKDEESISAIENIGVRVIAVKGREKISISVILTAFLRGLPLNVAKYYSLEMKRSLNSLIKEEDIDVVHFDHIHLGQYVDLCQAKYSVIDQHNVESMIMKRLYENEHNPFKKIVYLREYKKLAQLEKDKCRKASVVTVVSDEDKSALSELCSNQVNMVVIPNGVDVKYFGSQSMVYSPPIEEDIIVFTGAMDWMPNSDAIEYFIKDILPLIWGKKPTVKFYVVGKNPPARLKNFQKIDQRIVITGSVPDVRPFVLKSKVFVVPLRIGGGTRLKILEAMAMGKAIVSTSIGAEGLDTIDGQHLLMAYTPEEFACKVVMLFENDALRKKLGEEGKELVTKQYDWNIISKSLSDLYATILVNTSKH